MDIVKPPLFLPDDYTNYGLETNPQEFANNIQYSQKSGELADFCVLYRMFLGCWIVVKTGKWLHFWA